MKEVKLNSYERNILIRLLEHEMEYIGNEIENSNEYEEGLDKEYLKLYKLKEKLEED